MSQEQLRVIALADCQSFYASVEKAAHPEYKYKPLAVAGDPQRRSGIILAACPIAKSFGVTTAERLGEAMGKCPDLVIIRPRMQEYINVSIQITNILRTYTDLVEPYSIDEQHMDLTSSMKFFGAEPVDIARNIQQKVMTETGIYARIGISYCKVMAKMACDNFAKKNKDGIFSLPKEDISKVLWPLPVNQMFMVGSRMTAHFARIDILTIGDIATTPLPKFKEMMRRIFGKDSDIQAEVYWRISNGLDDSPVTLGTHDTQKSVGHQMTLPRDYGKLDDILVVMLELAELVCQRCRAKKYMGRVISVGCQGADYDRPTGFYRQMKLPDPTNLAEDVYSAATLLFKRHWNGLPVRKVGVTLSELTSDDQYQLILFDDREKKITLAHTIDEIKQRYGDAAIMRAVSITEAGQARDRSDKIGGHYK